jgi:uncharacterized protein YecE (DUF72 family)
VFYPAPQQRPRGFDELSFYAEHFDTVEVNSTFYGQPRAEVCRRWAQRTPPGFEFSLKLYQKFTHPTMFKSRLVGKLPEEADRESFFTARGAPLPRARAGALEDSLSSRGPQALADELARPNQVDLDEFRTGIEPLAAAGKLGALLAQFPPSFKDSPTSRDYLAGLLRALSGYPVAVELRHRTWSDRTGDTLSLLNSFGAAWVQIDEPKFHFSIRQNYLPNITSFYYMRLHGRNVARWWRHENAEDRYDYLYSAEELKEFTDTAGAVRRIVKKLYLYTNNHFSAKSIANAAMVKRQLEEPVDGDYSEAFLARYPELSGIVKVGVRDGASRTRG